jgi:hypothetical protein
MADVIIVGRRSLHLLALAWPSSLLKWQVCTGLEARLIRLEV